MKRPAIKTVMSENGAKTDKYPALSDTLTEVLPDMAWEVLADARAKMGRGIVPPQMINHVASRLLAQACGIGLGTELLEAKRGTTGFASLCALVHTQCSATAEVLSAAQMAPIVGPTVGMLVSVLHGVQIYCQRDMVDDAEED